MSGLIWVQTVCKGYQLTTKVATNSERVKTNSEKKCVPRNRIFQFVDYENCLFVLRFYGPVNPMGSCRARSVYLTTRLLGRFSPLSD